jgi:ArsR family transcriptional regulator, lead/cadmium/zinc/bismuth-responsive transcriptional repressor
MPENHAPSRASVLPPDLLEAVVETFKAVADPTRAQLVYLLTQRTYSVNELAERVPVSASAVSHHLARLRAIRLVRTRRDGNQIYYSIDDSHVAGLFREALAHLDHVRQNLPDQPYSPIKEPTSKSEPSQSS